MVYKIIFINDLSYVESIKQFTDDPCMWIVRSVSLAICTSDLRHIARCTCPNAHCTLPKLLPSNKMAQACGCYCQTMPCMAIGSAVLNQTRKAWHQS